MSDFVFVVCSRYSTKMLISVRTYTHTLIVMMKFATVDIYIAKDWSVKLPQLCRHTTLQYGPQFFVDTSTMYNLKHLFHNICSSYFLKYVHVFFMARRTVTTILLIENTCWSLVTQKPTGIWLIMKYQKLLDVSPLALIYCHEVIQGREKFEMDRILQELISMSFIHPRSVICWSFVWAK